MLINLRNSWMNCFHIFFDVNSFPIPFPSIWLHQFLLSRKQFTSFKQLSLITWFTLTTSKRCSWSNNPSFSHIKKITLSAFARCLYSQCMSAVSRNLVRKKSTSYMQCFTPPFSSSRRSITPLLLFLEISLQSTIESSNRVNASLTKPAKATSCF